MQLQRRFGMPVLVILVLVVWYASNRNADIPQSPATGDGVVEQAHAERRSGVWVEVDGRVARLLADDNEGSRASRALRMERARWRDPLDTP
jgi:hypothetical protein